MAVIDAWHGKDDNPVCDDDLQDDLDRGRNTHRWGDDRRPDCDRRDLSNRLVLVRNHERAGGTPYTENRAITYATDAKGGTTNLVFDAKRGAWLDSWSSLAGTWRNCAGAVTPWGTWITCEEIGNLPNHGWNFEVGSLKGNPKPLKDMGRFSHEAGMVDPRTGYVYQTEDSRNAGFYKFVPYGKGKLSNAVGNGFTEAVRLVGLTLDGRVFTFAQNNIVLSTDYNARVRAGDYRRKEWAGACYSPDGKWLFVNIQKPGVTFAITGPWGCRGPL
jgi:secreted PhoX family phosphatase